jgi:hypothetical protein
MVPRCARFVVGLRRRGGHFPVPLLDCAVAADGEHDRQPGRLTIRPRRSAVNS